MRNSKNKEKIIEILNLNEQPVNVHSIYDILNKEGNVNLSTVYRCINSLCKENIISKEIREDKNAYYSLNTNLHRHYLKCDICKKDILIDSCPITKLAKDIKEKNGFNITNHSLQISGICKKCSQNI